MQHLLLLHGAIGTAKQLELLEAQLSANYYIHKLEFSGHGNTPYAGEFSIERFAAEVLAYLDKHHKYPIDILGYSMGGFVALYLAKNHPQRVNKVISLAAKLYWDEAIAIKEAGMMNAEKIAAKLPAFAAELEQRHIAMGWKEMLQESIQMMTRLGTNNPIPREHYADITAPVLLLLGDRDKMVSLEETVAAYKAMPNAQMGTLPGTPHPLEQVNMGVLVGMVNSFLSNVV